MKTFLSINFVLLITFGTTYSQINSIPLWEDNLPNHKETDDIETQKQGGLLWIENVQQPSLEIFLPTKQSATGQAMIICPGGGYQGLAYDWEGTDIAKWLNSKGIAAFVLKYRLPNSKSNIIGHEAPLQDAKRAIRLVRHHSKKWNISPDMIGIMGFSAGGHLASTLGTHFENDKNNITNAIDNISTRPDFMVLIYPVITMDLNNTHLGSRNNLIGENPKNDIIDYYSNELHVSKNTPPTFILHATDDKVVPVINSILFYQALERKGVSSEMHIYPKGGHGFSLAIGKGHLQTWPDLLYEWLQFNEN